MITTSGDESTCMLLKQLSDLDQLDGVNAWLAGLGLTTLQLARIHPGSGGRWDPGRVTMTALDTARLLLPTSAPTPGSSTRCPEPAAGTT